MYKFLLFLSSFSGMILSYIDLSDKPTQCVCAHLTLTGQLRFVLIRKKGGIDTVKLTYLIKRHAFEIHSVKLSSLCCVQLL